MKVETPQLRWHQIVNPQCQKDAGANGPILSCTLHTAASDGVVVAGVLATAGNAEVNLWRVRFTHDDARLCRLPEATTGGPRSSSSRILVQPQTKSAASVVVAAPDGSAAKSAALEGGGDDDDERTVIEHVVTLSRGTNERGINCVRFSPSGRYLVAACDGGTVVLYALPHNVGDNNANNDATTNVVVDPARWTSIERETDLSAKILFNQSDDVMDASWSADSRRFAVCSLDHTLTVWEHHGGNNNGDGGGGGGDNNWKAVHRSNKDHTHYIQGVSYDPKGVYLASMGSDRMVKVYARKEIREGAVSAELAKYDADVTPPAKEEDGPPPPPPPPPPSSSSSMEEEEEEEEEDRLLRAEEERPPPRDSSSGESSRRAAILEDRVLPGLLTNTAFVLQNKIKTMKFLNANGKPARRSNSGESCGAGDDEDDTDNGKDALPPSSSLSSSPPPGKGTDDNNNPSPPPSSSAKRHHMFADELTLGSFFRRLSFTDDGAFLVVPAALWHGRRNNDDGGSDGGGGGGGGGGLSPGSPTSVLSGGVDRLADSSFATYLFARHHYDQPYKVLAGLEKPSVVVRPNPVLFRLPPNAAAPDEKPALPYRSVFAVLTTDSVVIYDTHHDRPLALARGLHYAGLTDAAWSGDGRTLFVTSSDGYVSILSFGTGELGDAYSAPTTTARIVDRRVSGSDASEGTAVGGSEDVSATTASWMGSGQQRPGPNDACVVNTLVPKKKMEGTAPDGDDATNSDTGVGKKRVRFGDPLDDRSNQPDPGQPVINNLVPKKKKKILPTLVVGTAQQIETIEKKQPEDIIAQTVDSQGPSINILVVKKKMKVLGSSTPVTATDV